MAEEDNAGLSAQFQSWLGNFEGAHQDAGAAARQSQEKMQASAQKNAASISKSEIASRAKIAAAQTSAQKSIAKGANQTQITTTGMTTQAQRDIAAGNNASQQTIANLSSQTQLQLQERTAAAEQQRQAAELANRLQIDNSDQAASMARLQAQLGVQQQDIEARLTQSREQLGFNREQLAANVQTEREKLAQARDEMLQVGIPTMLADRWYKEQQVFLAQSSQRIEEEKVGIQRGQLGLDAFNKSVELASSPAKYFQFGDFAQGLAANPQATDWLKAMAGETAGAGFGPSTDPGGHPITPQGAMAALTGLFGANPTESDYGAAQMNDPSFRAGVLQFLHDNGGTVKDGITWMNSKSVDDSNRLAAISKGTANGFHQGSAPTGGWAEAPAQAAASSQIIPPALQSFLDSQQKQLEQINTVARAGGSALAPGTLEKMKADNPDQLDQFTSGLAKLRYSTPDWMRSYQNAGVFQSSPDRIAA